MWAATVYATVRVTWYVVGRRIGGRQPVGGADGRVAAGAGAARAAAPVNVPSTPRAARLAAHLLLRMRTLLHRALSDDSPLTTLLSMHINVPVTRAAAALLIYWTRIACARASILLCYLDYVAAKCRRDGVL